MKNVNILEWYSCQLFWNTFEMACFIQVREYIIGVNCIWTSELRNDIQMKTIANFGMNSDFNILLQENGLSWVFYFLDTENF